MISASTIVTNPCLVWSEDVMPIDLPKAAGTTESLHLCGDVERDPQKILLSRYGSPTVFFTNNMS